jgi:predicted amidohydrolase
LLRAGMVQMASGRDKGENLRKAEAMINEALDGGAKLIILPELFSFLPPKIDGEAYRRNSEPLGGPTLCRLREVSKKEGVAIVAGSIIEAMGEKLYNTSCLILPSGEVHPYRKVHLFKYGSINETLVFSEGKGGAVFAWGGLQLGLTVCYDLRFPEIYRAEALRGANAICNVAAFLEMTGRAHWITLLRARAIENQVFVFAANQARGEGPGPNYYGNSCIIDPWGKMVARAGYGEEVLFGDVELARVEEVREKLPTLMARRPDAYGCGR